MRPHSRVVHAGRSDLTDLGVLAPPLDLSTAYPLLNLDEEIATLDRWSEGDRFAGNPIYTRVFNETTARFEDAVAELEGTNDAVAFSTGMAAISAVLLALKPETGGHLVALRPLYGTTDHLLASRLFGFDLTFAAPDEIERSLRPDTVAVILETPQNPTLSLVDIADTVARAHGVPVLVDNTFATPILQTPVAQGATFIVHSATKFMGGHGDVTGGVVATTEEWAKRLRQVRFATGALLHPFAAYLLHRGLQTLALRVEAAQQTARTLAARLSTHDAVGSVLYPETDPLAANLIGTQMRGPGALVAFDAGDGARAKHILGRLRLILHAVSLGSVNTLAEHPMSMTHRIIDQQAREHGNVLPGLIRISVGLEDVEDLWSDLAASLED